jgi:hypothetical protein
MTHTEIIDLQLANWSNEATAAHEHLKERIEIDIEQVFEWGHRYFEPICRGNFVSCFYIDLNLILEEQVKAGDNKNQIYKKLLQREADAIQKELLSNRHRANSTSAFTNACSESRREVRSQILNELRGMLKFLDGK